MSRPRTRAYIKQEDEDTKESLKSALYSPVKIEPPSLEISKCKSTSSRRIKKRHCNTCNVSFTMEKSFLDHQLHFHETKEKPIIDLKTLYCNICNKSYSCIATYRVHMAKLNNVHVPLCRPSKSDPSKTPDAEDPNNYCISCDYTFKKPAFYRRHLTLTHGMPYIRPKTTHRNERKPKDMKPKIDMLKMNCSACNKIFKSKEIYIRHLVKIHDITLPDIYSEPSNFDLKNRYCKVCDKKYSLNLAFTSHVRRIHHYTVRPANSDLIPNVKDQNNYCITCDKAVCSKPSYLRHLANFHIEKMPELYQGIDCKKTEIGKRNLGRYCVECKKIFLSRQLYRIHLDKIHGIKQLEPLISLPNTDDPDMNHPEKYCTSCKKTYSGANNFRQHLRHEHRLILPSKYPIRGERSNITPREDLEKKHCNVCDRVYRTLDSYRIHMSKYHDMKISSGLHAVNRKEIPVIDQISHRCTACNKTYKSRTIFAAHLYRVHGILLPKKKNRLKTNPDIIPDMDDQNNHCASCDKTYCNRHSYECHLATVHDMRRKETAIKEECN